jgi:amidophosphoribosyltransferase
VCGFIGIANSPTAGAEIYDGLIAIQHRGQDAAGILTVDAGGHFHGHKDAGLVRDVFRADHLARMAGRTGIGHVRYPTVGAGGPEDAQPFVTQYPFGIAMAHNGNVTNYEPLADDLRVKERRWLESRCDVEVILQVFAAELARRTVGGFSVPAYLDAVRTVLQRVQGAYSVVGVINGHGLFAFRDPHGIKPIVLGRRANEDGSSSWCVASESVVPDLLGFDELRDVRPGEAVWLTPAGEIVAEVVHAKEHAPCVFEQVYFARPDSFIDKVSVYKTRLRMGEALARRVRDEGWEVDVVIPVPESSCTAALSLAQSLGKPYREGFVKNRYIGRTFIMPGQDTRQRSVKHKLNAIDLEFEDKNVLIVDDSIVRGTTSKQIIAMAREAGAKRVYFASCAPPIRHQCVYGIDMSTRAELVAREGTVEDIQRVLGADGLVYQRLEDLVDATRAGNPALKDTCHACFSGRYPTGDVDEAVLVRIESERLGHQG